MAERCQKIFLKNYCPRKRVVEGIRKSRSALVSVRAPPFTTTKSPKTGNDEAAAERGSRLNRK